MNRTVKEATIKAFHYSDLESLKAHVLTFVSAYNFAKHLKALRWKTPFEAVCHAWTTTPEIFKGNSDQPRHLRRPVVVVAKTEKSGCDLRPEFGVRGPVRPVCRIVAALRTQLSSHAASSDLRAR